MGTRHVTYVRCPSCGYGRTRPTTPPSPLRECPSCGHRWDPSLAVAFAPTPKAKVEVEGLSYRMTVKGGGRPARTFSGHSTEELERDLRAAADELKSDDSGRTP